MLHHWQKTGSFAPVTAASSTAQPLLRRFETAFGFRIGGLRVQHRLVLALGLAVFLQFEVGVAERNVRRDTATGRQRLLGKPGGLSVILLLESDLGQAEQRRPALASVDHTREGLLGLV